MNIDANKEQEITIDLGSMYASSVTGSILRSDKLQDHNTFENPDKVKPVVFTGAALKDNSISVKLPPFSVIVLELK